MRRPQRKVTSVEYFERKEHDHCGMSPRMVEMSRFNLECGHYVEVRRTPHPRRRFRCAVCQGRRMGKWDMVLASRR